MFSKLYEWYLSDDHSEFLGCAIIAPFLVCNILLHLVLSIYADETNTAYPDWGWTLLVIAIFGMLIPFLLAVFDTAARKIIDYITHGDYTDIYVVGKFLFGEQYCSKKVHNGRYVLNIQTFNTRWGGMYLLFLPITAFIEILIVSPVSVFPYLVGLGIIIIGGWGMIELAHKVYGLRKKLTDHVNDPNAHSNS